MKLGTLRNGSRDGALVVVSRDNTVFALASDISPNLRMALENWDEVAPKLHARFEEVQNGTADVRPVEEGQFHAPLPRAWEWVDGSAFLNHVILVRKARNAAPPATLETDPLVYQGGSGIFLGPTEDIELHDVSWGLDFESEIGVLLGDTPLGTTTADAGDNVKLLVLLNDITLRSLIPTELKKGFGFFNGKPATAFAPFAVTPDELGDTWVDGRAHVRVHTSLNGEEVGSTDAGPEMHFSFFELIQHIAKTRAFSAGTILGSGTVSNADRARGISCLAERRMIEIIETGAATTRFMEPGDHVRIEVLDAEGASLFGAVDQRVVSA
jgi:fumarylacetoacetate (FAA) hydrolase